MIVKVYILKKKALDIMMRQIEKELNVKKWIQKRRLDLMESKEMKDEWNNLLLLILIILEIILRGKLKDKIREIKTFNIL